MNERSLSSSQVIELAGFRIAFSSKREGNMDFRFDSAEVVQERRSAFTTHFFANSTDLHVLDLAHSSNIHILNADGSIEFRSFEPLIETDFPGYRTKADCTISRTKRVLLGMVSADCIPIGLVAPAAGLFGIAHVGLLGLLNGNISNILLTFESLLVPRNDLRFILGPAITGDAYNLSNSGLWRAIETQVERKCESFLHRINHLVDGDHLDIRLAAKSQLLELGIQNHQIQQHGGIADGVEFYSNYAAKRFETEDGRFFTVIGAAPAKLA